MEFDGNEIEFTEEELKDLHQLLQEAMAEKIVENYDFSSLTKKAEDFINIYERLFKELKSVNEELKMAKKNDVNNIQGKNVNHRGLRQKRTQYLRDIYKKAFVFDSELSNFLYGNKFPKQGYYVYEDKKTHKLSTYPMNLEDMTNFIYGEDLTARINLGKRKLNQFLAQTNQVILEDQKQDKEWQEKVEKARAAYAGSQNRLEVYYDRLSEETDKKQQKQGGYLLWKQHNKWQYIQITNSGDLKEAYVQMLYEEHIEKISNITMGEAPYYSHDLIGLFAGYAGTVTNTPAILEEDVVTFEGQFGIKSSKAQMPSLNQYLYAANAVIKASKSGKIDKKYIASVIASKYNQNVGRNFTKDVNDSVKSALSRATRSLGQLTRS